MPERTGFKLRLAASAARYCDVDHRRRFRDIKIILNRRRVGRVRPMGLATATIKDWYRCAELRFLVSLGQ